MANNNINRCIIILAILLSQSLIAQGIRSDTSETKMYNNSLNLSIGPGGLLVGHAPIGVFYERMFQGVRFGPKISSIVDVGVGYAEDWGISGPYYMARYGILTGNKKSHLEVKAGATILFGDLQPSFAIGYRSQKPQSHFIFRTGFGWPENLYVSWGVSF
jgi:hypothetical protein